MPFTQERPSLEVCTLRFGGMNFIFVVIQTFIVRRHITWQMCACVWMQFHQWKIKKWLAVVFNVICFVFFCRCCCCWYCITLTSSSGVFLIFLFSWDVMNTKIKDKSLSVNTLTHTHIYSHVRTTFHRFLCLYMCQTLAHTDYIKRLMRKLAARWTITALTERAHNEPMSADSAYVRWFFFVVLCRIWKITSSINKRRKHTHIYHIKKVTHKPNKRKWKWKWHTLEIGDEYIRYYILYRVLGMSILMDQTWKLNKSVGCMWCKVLKRSLSVTLLLIHTPTPTLTPFVSLSVSHNFGNGKMRQKWKRKRHPPPNNQTTSSSTTSTSTCAVHWNLFT